MDTKKTQEIVFKAWDDHIVPTLCKYIEIPNQSPNYDSEWETNGLQEKAIELMMNWVKDQKVPDLKMELITEKGRTPLIFIEVPATTSKNTEETVLLYGHMDKQPPLTESWSQGLHPYKPVIRDDKLYGRGGADDGYAIFASIQALKTLKDQNVPHARCVIMVEASEESGSPDLPFYVQKLADRIKTPSLIVCLDSGCGNYEQFWITTSLRGVMMGNLRVEVVTEGVHSGHGSGVIPSSFRVIRQLLDRLEDSKTGEILLKDLFVDIPKQRLEQTKLCAEALGREVIDEMPWVKGMQPVSQDPYELLLNRSWRPTLCVVGAEGMPHVENAGNVLRTHTTLRLSIRTPPTLKCPEAIKAVKKVLEQDPPYGAKVTFEANKAGSGWEAPPLAPWLQNSMNAASQKFFEKDANFLGEGGSIPFMGMLGERFPKAQFVIAGVLGPQSNAHGPNEMLHIPMGKKLTCCVASIVADHASEFCK